MGGGTILRGKTKVIKGSARLRREVIEKEPKLKEKLLLLLLCCY